MSMRVHLLSQFRQAGSPCIHLFYIMGRAFGKRMIRGMFFTGDTGGSLIVYYYYGLSLTFVLFFLFFIFLFLSSIRTLKLDAVENDSLFAYELLSSSHLSVSFLFFVLCALVCWSAGLCVAFNPETWPRTYFRCTI